MLTLFTVSVGARSSLASIAFVLLHIFHLTVFFFCSLHTLSRSHIKPPSSRCWMKQQVIISNMIPLLTATTVAQRNANVNGFRTSGNAMKKKKTVKGDFGCAQQLIMDFGWAVCVCVCVCTIVRMTIMRFDLWFTLPHIFFGCCFCWAFWSLQHLSILFDLNLPLSLSASPPRSFHPSFYLTSHKFIKIALGVFIADQIFLIAFQQNVVIS